jgi:hypothetical protein
MECRIFVRGSKKSAFQRVAKQENGNLGMPFDSLTKAFARGSGKPGTCTQQIRALFWGELMKIVVVTNILRPVGNGKTFVFNLRGAAPGSAGDARATAM